MTGSGNSYNFVYVHTDIPEGMTIREWRAQRAAERTAIREAAGRERRRRRVEATRRRLTALGLPALAPRLGSREVHG
jgi:hypothetical protein